MNNKLRRSTLLASASTQGGSVDNGFYNPNPNYLTIVALEDGLTASLSTNDVEYSIDGNDNWTTLSAGTASPAINKNHYISFRGNLTPTSSKGIGTFTINKSCDLTGNCNSLLFGDNAADNNSLSGKDYAFYYLFRRCSTIRNVSSNFLPATTLANYCYNRMFYNCTSLTTALELPATTLATYCYNYMFYNCTSLTTAPELPATTLANGCYYYMFYGCRKLNYIKALFTTTPSSSYTSNWVSGVASSGIFVKNKNAAWNVTGTNGIPSGWTVKLV